jgi:hypothetical protein
MFRLHRQSRRSHHVAMEVQNTWPDVSLGVARKDGRVAA